MNDSAIVKDVQVQLRKAATEKVRISTLHFFKEKITPIGVNNPTMRSIAKEIVRHYNAENKKLGMTIDWFDVIDSLLKTGVYEDGYCGLMIAEYVKTFQDEKAISHYEKWLEKYVHNWAWDDQLCCCVIGPYWNHFPEKVKATKKWIRSSNRWVARAAVVSLIPVVRQKRELNLLFDHVCYLKKTDDDLLHKAMGWTLREAWKKEPKKVEAFLLKEKGLPRTTVRYAIERLPENKRKRFLELTRID